jgi:hypothetical protein
VFCDALGVTDNLQQRLDQAWSSVLARIDWETAERNARYDVLVAEAARRAELRGLFPFTSQARLCFSRCSDYPFTFDCPCIAFHPDGYLVQATWAVSDQPSPLLLSTTEDVQLAVEVLVQNLPDDRSAWVGTSERRLN